MAKRKVAKIRKEAKCVICGRKFQVNIAKDQTPHDLCCRSFICDAIKNWTDEEWKSRAYLAANRPPYKVGQPVYMGPQGFCTCKGPDNPVEMKTFVANLYENGNVKFVSGCPECKKIKKVWFDNPSSDIEDFGAMVSITYQDGVSEVLPLECDPSRWIDREALNRYPDIESYWPKRLKVVE